MEYNFYLFKLMFLQMHLSVFFQAIYSGIFSSIYLFIHSTTPFECQVCVLCWRQVSICVCGVGVYKSLGVEMKLH